MKKHPYEKFPQIFSEELSIFKKKNNIKSDEKFAEKCFKTGGLEYDRWAIANFRNGKRVPHDSEIVFFADLFEIRAEYLKGEDKYRTDEDLYSADILNMQKESLLHRLIVSLGFSDSIMEDEDFNSLFPSNTRLFIDKFKKHLSEEGRSDDVLICDVNTNTFRLLPKEEYNILLNEIYSFINFKLHLIMDDPKVQEIPYVGGVKNKYDIHMGENRDSYEFNIPFSPEFKYYNKKTGAYESSSKDLNIDNTVIEVIEELEKHNNANKAFYKEKIATNFQAAYNNAVQD
ncbi:MAG: hypothetical protein K6E95_03235 [Lachnospiraceae bacterium]|nr:hypothetical protein [Lachnospiraceae bacterium]